MATTRPAERLRRSAALLLLGLAGTAAAQWRLEPTLTSSLMASNNIDMAQSSSAKSDLVLSLGPRLLVHGKGGSYQVEGSVSTNAVAYLQGSLASRILPVAHLGANTRLVDQMLFLDSRVDVETTSADPFQATAGGAAAYNRQLVRRLRLSPYVDRKIQPGMQLTARIDQVWTTTGSTTGSILGTDIPGTRSQVQSDLLKFDVKPQPLGYQIELTRVDTRMTQSGKESDVLNDTARAVLSYAPDPELQLGLRAGRDKVVYSATSIANSFTGYGLRWQPSQRTSLDTAVERRFFGNGWTLQFVHRSPFLVLTTSAARQLATYAQSLANLPTSGSASALLDAAYRTSVADEAKRAELVRSLIARYNLPENLSGPVELFSNRPQVQQVASLNLALLGPRHSVSMRLYQQKTEDLPDQDPILALIGRRVLQQGWSANFDRRLTPSFNATIAFSRAVTRDVSDPGGEAVTRGARLELVNRLSGHTTLTGGVRRTLSTSTMRNGIPQATESAIFIGLNQSF